MPRELGILITGAGGGIGKGLALRLAARGHRIIVTDIDQPAAEAVAGEIAAAAGRASAHALDVTSEEAVAALTSQLGDAPVDVLINNAGIQHVAPLEDFAQEKWDQVVNIILRGAVLVTRAVLPGMRARGFGRIVNIGSIHALVASPCKTAYVAAKHGLHGFSKVVALETADADITINTICPSYIRTALIDKQIAGQAQAHGIAEDDVVQKIMLEPMPKKAFVTIEEVAATAEFFISDAARNITGQAIAIDGGWTVR